MDEENERKLLSVSHRFQLTGTTHIPVSRHRFQVVIRKVEQPFSPQSDISSAGVEAEKDIIIEKLKTQLKEAQSPKTE